MAASRTLKELAADRVVRRLQDRLPPTRSSEYSAARHAALHRRRYERALEGRVGAAAPSELACEARVFVLLGRRRESEDAFAAALRLDPECAAARAWRWDADFSSSPGRGFAEIDGAVRSEPSNPLWRALRGVGRAAEFLVDQSGARAAPLEDLEAALDLDPDYAPALVAAGLVRVKEGRQREALSLFSGALRVTPRAAFLHQLQSAAHLQLGDVAAFVEECERAVYGSEALGYFLQIFDVDPHGLPGPQQVEAATRYLRRHPRAYWMYACRGDIRRAPDVNDHLGGLRDLETAVELKPDCAYAWAYLSRARLTHGTASSAMAAADRSVALRPDCGWVSIWRGEIRRRLGDLRGAISDFDRGLKLDPDYELGYAWRGGAKLSEGRAEEALEDIELAIALDPRAAWPHQERSLALRRLGRTAEALESLTRAYRLDAKFSWCADPARAGAALAELDRELDRSPRNAWAWAWRAETRIRTGDDRGAAQDLDRALALDPGLAPAWAWRGRVRQRLGRRRSALRDLDRAVRLDPGDAHALAWRGRVRGLLGLFRGALLDLRRAAEMDRKSSWIYLWKAEAEEARGLLAAAERSLDQSLAVDRNHVAAMVARSRVRSRRGNSAGARSDAQRACELAPLDPGANYRRGVLNEGEGRWGEARADYERAMKRAAELAPAELRAASRYLTRGPVASARAIKKTLAQARISADAGRHAQAAADCTEILRAAPSCTKALRVRGEARRCLGEYEESVADFSVLARLLPNDSDTWLSLGAARRNAWDFSGALEAAERALRLIPGSSGAHLLRSEALRNVGRFDEAVAAAGRAVASEPRRAWARVVLGKALRQAGEPQRALVEFRRAILLDPKDAKARGWAADALRKLGRSKQAAEAARQAVALMPTCAWAVALQGEIERESGRRVRGFRLMRRAVELDPNCSCAHDFLGADPPTVWSDSSYAWVYAWRGGVRRNKKDWRAARRDLTHAVELDPRCLWARRGLGELNLAMGDASGALRELKRALDECPSDVEAWVWRGRAEGERGRWKAALSWFTRALSLDSANPYALIGCSLSHQKLGRADRAAEFMRLAERSAPALFRGADAAR